MLDPVRDEEASEDRVDRVGMSSLPGVLLSSELGDEARELISLYGVARIPTVSLFTPRKRATAAVMKAAIINQPDRYQDVLSVFDERLL